MTQPVQPKIYVAGHRGMVGSAIVRQLLALGHAPQQLITRTHAELDQIATAVILAGGLAYSSSQKSKAARAARAAFNASQVDRMVNVASSVAGRELVLGRVRKGGAVFFKGATGTNNDTFVMCLALAAHEIDAVETVYLNDVPVRIGNSTA